MKVKKVLKKIFMIFIALIIAVIVYAFGIFAYVRLSTKSRIISIDEAMKLKDVDCIIVLGASVKPNSKPSLMLADRLDKSVEAYDNKLAPKIIMSGDHTSRYYNEVQVMKDYVCERGVNSSDVFMDHGGISTYDTMFRAKNVFGVKKAIIITQKYHLYRAIYDAKQMGIEAYGVSCVNTRYAGQNFRSIREVLATNKDFLWCLFKIDSKFLGEPIPLSEDGNITNSDESTIED